MARLRILQVIDSLAAGGAERMAVDLANLANRAAIEMHVIATRGGGPLEDELGSTVQYSVLGRRTRWDPSGVARLARYVRNHNIDVVHSHGVSSMQFVSLLRVLRQLESAHVFHDHVSVDVPLNRIGAAAVTLGVDIYVAVDQTRFGHVVARTHLQPGAANVVRNGTDTARFTTAQPIHGLRTELGIPANHVVGAYVANVRPMKGHVALLESLDRCRHRDDVSLLIIGSMFGDDYERRVLDTVHRLALGSHVHFLGPRLDVPAILKSSDFGIMTSEFETGPLAVIEYCAAGLPTMTTDSGEIVAALREQEGVLIVPCGNRDALATVLDDIVDMGPIERARLGDANRRVAIADFDQTRTAHRMQEIYQQAVDFRNRRQARLGPLIRSQCSLSWSHASAES